MSDLWWNLTFDVNFHFKHLKLHISGVFSTGATGAIAPVILRKRLIAPVILAGMNPQGQPLRPRSHPNLRPQQFHFYYQNSLKNVDTTQAYSFLLTLEAAIRKWC